MNVSQKRQLQLQKGWLYILVLGAILTVALAGFFYFRGRSVLFYATATVAFATVLYVASRTLPAMWLPINVPDRSVKALRLAGFVCIVALVAIPRGHGPARPTVYFVLYAATVGLIGFTALVAPDLRSVVQIVLLTLGTASSLYHSVPLVGVDTAFHQNAVGYMMATGEVVPITISYYHWYPISHTSGAMVGLVGGLEAKISFFLATAGLTACGGILLYSIARELSPPSFEQKAGLLALLVVPISAQNLKLLSIPIGQTMTLLFVPAIFYLLVRRQSRRFDALLLGFLLVVSGVHVLAPFVFSGFIGIMFCYELVLGRLWPHDDPSLGFEWRRPLLVLGVVVTKLFEYLMFTEKLNLQVSRILVLFSAGGSVSNAVSGAGNSLSATNILLNVDPLLQFAGSLLLIAMFVVIAVYGLIDRVLTGSPSRMDQWIIICGVAFGGFAVGFIAGHGSSIGRAFPTVMLLIAPIVGIEMLKSRTELGTPGTVILVTLLVAGAFFAATSPATAIPERSTGFEATLTNSEMAAIEYVGDNEIESYGHTYLAQRETSLRIQDGDTTDYVHFYYNARFPEPEMFSEYAHDHEDVPFVHQTYYDQNGGVTPPDSFSTVYDAGGSRIVVPPKQSID